MNCQAVDTWIAAPDDFGNIPRFSLQNGGRGPISIVGPSSCSLCGTERMFADLDINAFYVKTLACKVIHVPRHFVDNLLVHSAYSTLNHSRKIGPLMSRRTSVL